MNVNIEISARQMSIDLNTVKISIGTINFAGADIINDVFERIWRRTQGRSNFRPLSINTYALSKKYGTDLHQ